MHTNTADSGLYKLFRAFGNAPLQARRAATAERQHGLLRLIGSLSVGLLAMVGATTAHAKHAAVAPELASSSTSQTAPVTNWANSLNGQLYYKVLIFSNSTDPDLTTLRQAVLTAGGSVYYRYTSLAALAAMLPASQIATFSQRPDVLTISPNRLTSKSASILQQTTGSSLAAAPGYAGNTTGFDGTGVGIAILDSGIDSSHANFVTGKHSNRVATAIDFTGLGDKTSSGQSDWTIGVDVSASLYPGSSSMAGFEGALINKKNAQLIDPFGHGSHVAGVAAGNGSYQQPDSTGIAPNATLIDVRVLNAQGYGEIADVLSAIDWVIYHAKDQNIRVMNLSLATDSTESYLTDPLCQAVRTAEAAGITVVVAAGNFGISPSGQTAYGSISSPGDEPSVITVGSANLHGHNVRSAATVNHFSSRGPTLSGYYIDASGVSHFDDNLKPDLVAPGNAIVSVLSANFKGDPSTWNLLATTYPQLAAVPGAAQSPNQTLMYLSGTSIATPVVTGTVALMLQANPGLTPPLIKAILQYTAQTLPGASLADQGAGMINIDGAVRLAAAMRPDIGPAITAGTINPGDSLLAAPMPVEASTIAGESVPWGRIAFVGGNQIAGGDALVTTFQPIWDPRVYWAGQNVWVDSLTYWPAAHKVPANTYLRSISSAVPPNQVLLTAGPVIAGALIGDSSYIAQSGVFTPTSYLASLLTTGSGTTLQLGVVYGTRAVMSEGVVMGNGVVMSERAVMSEGVVLGERAVMAERAVMSEAGSLTVSATNDPTPTGEP